MEYIIYTIKKINKNSYKNFDNYVNYLIKYNILSHYLKYSIELFQ